jgi:EAL domain-containing protein (putative c-di-GMP-specific phosphodiesterase class I)
VRNATDRLVIAAVVDIARGMGKKTIAEFVTDGPTQRLLKRLGVDHAQGTYVGEPGPRSALGRTRLKH